MLIFCRQVMLKQDSGEYACIAEDVARYNLGDVKEEMQAAMGLNTEVRMQAVLAEWSNICSFRRWHDDAGGGQCYAIPPTR